MLGAGSMVRFSSFKTKVKPPFDICDTLAALDHQMTAAIDPREDADAETSRLSTLVVHSVKGDPAFGEDSELYEAMGYVRKSERKRALTRKKAAPVPAKQARRRSDRECNAGASPTIASAVPRGQRRYLWAASHGFNIPGLPLSA